MEETEVLAKSQIQETILHHPVTKTTYELTRDKKGTQKKGAELTQTKKPSVNPGNCSVNKRLLFQDAKFWNGLLHNRNY